MKSNIQKANLKEVSKQLSALKTDTILVVVDSRVWQLYGKALQGESLAFENKKVLLYKSLEGEQTKNIQEFEKGLEYFLEKGIHRDCHMLAIGGGATSDYAGYLSSSLLRGISWSVLPTTLLSMVDASIGGKTGINSKSGKNLIGSFHMPTNVWIDESFLETLSKEEFDSGKGEIIKYGFLSHIVSDLLKQKAPLNEIIEACALLKEEIVQRDFKEGGERVCLNLGHTFGHALERIYDLPHGVAVFWGMALIFKLWGSDNSLLQSMREFEKGVGADFGQPPWLNKTFPVDKIMDYISKDKKVKNQGIINLVTIEKMGEFKVKPIKVEEVRETLGKKKDELKTFNF